MKWTTTCVFAVLTIAALFFTPTAAQAQSELKLKVTIPFGFTVGNKGFPSGEYFVSNRKSRVVAIESVNSHVNGQVSTSLGNWDNPLHKNVLVFQRWGDHYALRHVVGSSMNLNIPTWKEDQHEKAQLLHAQNEKPEEVVISAVVASR